METKNLLSNKPRATPHMFWPKTTLNDEPRVNESNNYCNPAMCPLSSSTRCTALPFPSPKRSTRWLQYELRLMRSLTLMKKQPSSPPPSHNNCHIQVPPVKTLSDLGSKHFQRFFFFPPQNWGHKQWLKRPAIFEVLRWPIKVKDKLREAKLAPHRAVVVPRWLRRVLRRGRWQRVRSLVSACRQQVLKIRARKQMRREIDPVRAVDAAAV